MKRKVRLLAFLFLSLLFLVGWGKKEVELLDDKPLIDLNKALGICLPGSDASSDETTSDSGKESKTIIIHIRDRKVTYDSVLWEDLNKLDHRIRQDYADHASFRLIDDYAESHVYKKVKNILSELESEIGLVYTTE